MVKLEPKKGVKKGKKKAIKQAENEINALLLETGRGGSSGDDVMNAVQDASIQAKALNKKDKKRLSRLREKAAAQEEQEPDQSSVKITDSSFDEIVR